MSSGFDRVHLLAPPGVEIDARRCAEALQPWSSKHLTNLAIDVRTGGGWLVRELNVEHLDAVRAALIGAGVEPLVVPSDGGPIGTPDVRQVRTVEGEITHLQLTTRDGAEELALDTVACALLLVEGEVIDSNLPTLVEAIAPLLATARGPIARQRDALGPAKFSLQAASLCVVLREPVDILDFTPATRFLNYRARGAASALDAWLHFQHDLVAALGAGKCSPALAEFWRDGSIEGNILNDRVERQNRLSWLAELVARDWWKGAS
ncbi:MAG: hypothetical protein ACKVX7_05645 [Planctomycetota bacterium]